ncbi:polysaccharide pyruvyl transferase family protein [Lachnotalea sp. AF33-28]|uniref:polysaccharide pyruvyl transferase family protein n=1 Tax=Lachnotalea sp. AF33-28 TaxID=2292046 RepID=UPI0013144FF8|nr:polysaccharide pyruvyl transferase family protein [Lachnotalea sp. AF33-28]
MNKYYVVAYKEVNFGDDLLMDTLFCRYPEAEFVMTAPGCYRKIFNQYGNLKIICRDSFIYKIFNKLVSSYSVIMHRDYPKCLEDIIINSFKRIIYIGGSIFIEKEDAHQVSYERKWWKKAIDGDKKVYILDANFGPFRSASYTNAMQSVFKKCQDVCFRDQYSFHMFSHIKTVRYGNDIAFLTKTCKRTKNVSDKYVFVSVVYPANNFAADLNVHNEYIRKMAEMHKSAQKYGLGIKYVAFCKFENDDKTLDEIKNVIGDSDTAEYIVYDGNIEEIKQMVTDSVGVISARFHGMVLSSVQNRPTFYIAYSTKGINVIQDNHLDINYIRLKDIKDIDSDRIIASMVHDQGKLLLKEEIYKSANEQFIILDKENRNTNHISKII